MTSHAQEILERQKGNLDEEQASHLLAEGRQKLQKTVQQDMRTSLAGIRSKADASMKEAVRALEAEKKKKQDLVAWKSKVAIDTAKQQAVTAEVLQDAQQTIALLHSLKSPGGMPEFGKQVQVLESECRSAVTLYDQGMYGAAHASSSNIVMQGASLVRENLLYQTEHGSILTELEAALEGLIEEVERNRTLELQDPESGERFVEDLNEFSGDGRYEQPDPESSQTEETASRPKRYEQFLSDLESELEKIRKEGDSMSNFELLKFQEKLNEEYRGTAEELFEESTQALRCYYQKTHVMDVIADFMEGQGYEVSWVQPAGDDLTNKLVVNFKSLYAENSVSFTVDLSGDGSDISSLVLDMMMFYQQKEVTEKEKQALREHINEALHRAGISGGISCTGSIDRPSPQIEYNSQQAVQDMRKN